MEVKNIKIKNMTTADFKDNEYLEQYVEQLREGGVNVAIAKLDDIINWGRSNSVWPLTFATSCCGIEFMSLGAARFDFSRFGWEVTRNSPRQADVVFCAISGGPFKKSYHTVMGIDQIIPVDVYVPGCPPSPNAIIYGMLQLSRKIKVQEFFSLPKQPKVVEHLDNPIEVVKYV